MIHRTHGRIRLPVLLALMLLGCDEELLLVTPTDRAFTLYGVLNPAADTQYVHVFPVEPTLEPAPPEPLDARFTSTELETGETRVWSDSLVRDERGLYSHVFWSPFRVGHDREYRLEVSGDERASRVDVRVPPRVTPIVEDPTVTGEIIYPVRLRGEAPRLLKAEVTFWSAAITGFAAGGAPIYLHRHLTLPVAAADLVRNGEGWLYRLNLSDGYRHVYNDMTKHVNPSTLRANGMELFLITLDAIVANEEWNPPNGSFDPAELVHPEAMSNVQNGFGFVGAGYRIRHQWRPTAEAARAVGFKVW